MNNVTIIIVGATGDLARRKLIPALYELLQGKKLDRFLVLGIARDAVTREQFHAVIRESLPATEMSRTDQKVVEQLCAMAFYEAMDVHSLDDFKRCATSLQALEQQHTMSGNRVLYCALPSEHFCAMTQHASASGFITRQKNHRIVYEKPFGTDGASARAINDCIKQCIDESQIYRADHYMTKELVGNIALVRFTNSIFEPLWSSKHIESVHIMLHEAAGLDNRGSYYDVYGVVKDVVQNHMLQMLALVAMEEPRELEGDAIRDEKVRVLKTARVVAYQQAQYNGYRQEPQVKPDSVIPTCAFLELALDNERWRGVPFYLSTGKRLDRKETSIHIKFKSVVCALRQAATCPVNYLTIRVHPEAGFSLSLNAKKPGTLFDVMAASMDFCHSCVVPEISEYRVMLEEVVAGEQAVGVRFDEIEAAWTLIDTLAKSSSPLLTYEPGSKGPQAMIELAHNKGLRW